MIDAAAAAGRQAGVRRQPRDVRARLEPADGGVAGHGEHQEGVAARAAGRRAARGARVRPAARGRSPARPTTSGRAAYAARSAGGSSATCSPAVRRSGSSRWTSPTASATFPDLARAFVLLGTRDGGRRAGVAHAGVRPGHRRELIEAAARAAGVKPRPALLKEGTVTFYGIFVPTFREYPELAYQWDAPFVSDAGKFLKAFGPFAADASGRGSGGDRRLVQEGRLSRSGPGLPGESGPDKVAFVTTGAGSRLSASRRAFLPHQSPQTL